jgi:drug/metabolite transporter (DMT)-like permease
MSINPYLIILFTGVIIASFSQIILKKSAGKTYPSRIREYVNPYVITGYSMMFGAVFCSMMSYRGFDYTKVPLMESSAYILVMFLSYFFFKEKITRRKLLGVITIMVGIYVYHL